MNFFANWPYLNEFATIQLMWVRGLFIIAISALAFPLWAEDNPFPRAASLKRSEVNVRAGPGTRYPILWVFQRRGWPVVLLAKYDNWYKIRDIEGEEGWVYIGMVSSQHTAVVSSGEPATLYKKADGTRPTHLLESGVVVALNTCSDIQCEVTVQGADGWVDRQRLVQSQ
ncbi:MAG: SH3 domain-containing protein [Alphaproteobacteria bacterium]|nr:SH3 domain-containing protein [Alphaproteobacteria bacterium]MDD9919298.1 SH3 domain-containing protein [Alphaproteobacteria bacterium]